MYYMFRLIIFKFHSKIVYYGMNLIDFGHGSKGQSQNALLIRRKRFAFQSLWCIPITIILTIGSAWFYMELFFTIYIIFIFFQHDHQRSIFVGSLPFGKVYSYLILILENFVYFIFSTTNIWPSLNFVAAVQQLRTHKTNTLTLWHKHQHTLIDKKYLVYDGAFSSTTVIYLFVYDIIQTCNNNIW